MECRQCATALERPGDYCLVCRTPNADAVVIDAARDRATVTMLDEETVVGETTITTTPEDGDESIVELRNFTGRIADEVRRKRPETVYVAGERDVIAQLRGDLHHEFFRVPDDDSVAAAVDRRDGRAPEVVDLAPAEKIGGTHSTLIGGRAGMRAVQTVAGHPHVKKIVPGPIENGSTAEGGLRAKATRADGNGNVRLLLRDGATVQENRVVTTAMDRETGERVSDDLDEALAEADFQ
ncbi:metal-binding protein [Halobacteriales archaeon QS_1_68_20]|nr:MAG: metal-binding protein [Halobacteriales archaeon QS_1_68_20]